MKTMPRTMVSTLIAVSTSGVLMAQAPQLSIRMGYWEIATTINMGGAAPVVDTSKMSAQQKAQVEAMMQAMTKPQTITDKQCITREDFERELLFNRDPDDDCTQLLTTNTATVLEGTITCKGDNAMTGTMRIQASSPTAFSGAMRSSGSQGGRQITMSATMDAKFVSATCPKE